MRSSNGGQSAAREGHWWWILLGGHVESNYLGEAMFDECVIRGRRFVPARFCAPLVGYTHSAFRRLLAELGGCGGVWTEMLAARQILAERDGSSWLRRHPQENCLFYQLMMNAHDPVERVLARLQEGGADALDLNLACNSRTARQCLAGSALFADFDALRKVVGDIRKHWPHIFTAKIRLGRERPDWKERFVERLKLLEDSGVDAVILHTRFVEDKFGRRARHELYPWAASLTRLPLIANGDLCGPETLLHRPGDFQGVSGIMLGRMAIARPWIFSIWDRPSDVSHAEIWTRLHQYVAEDFPPAVALRRLQMFNKYFAANFHFGHQFKVELSHASSLEEMREKAVAFFSRGPALVAQPTVVGL